MFPDLLFCNRFALHEFFKLLNIIITVKSNTITFTASSMTEATGTDSSSYEHPKMTCEWGFDISLSRDADDVSEHTVSGQGDAGLDDADGDGGGCSVVAPTSRVHFSLIGILAYLFG